MEGTREDRSVQASANTKSIGTQVDVSSKRTTSTGATKKGTRMSKTNKSAKKITTCDKVDSTEEDKATPRVDPARKKRWRKLTDMFHCLARKKQLPAPASAVGKTNPCFPSHGSRRFDDRCDEGDDDGQYSDVFSDRDDAAVAKQQTKEHKSCGRSSPGKNDNQAACRTTPPQSRRRGIKSNLFPSHSFPASSAPTSWKAKKRKKRLQSDDLIWEKLDESIASPSLLSWHSRNRDEPYK